MVLSTLDIYIEITMDILDLLGDASGLKTNVQKSNAYPIRVEKRRFR